MLRILWGSSFVDEYQMWDDSWCSISWFRLPFALFLKTANGIISPTIYKTKNEGIQVPFVIFLFCFDFLISSFQSWPKIYYPKLEISVALVGECDWRVSSVESFSKAWNQILHTVHQHGEQRNIINHCFRSRFEHIYYPSGMSSINYIK